MPHMVDKRIARWTLGYPGGQARHPACGRGTGMFTSACKCSPGRTRTCSRGRRRHVKARLKWIPWHLRAETSLWRVSQPWKKDCYVHLIINFKISDNVVIYKNWMPTIFFLADEMNECILIHVRFAGTSTPHSPMALPQVLPGLRFQILPLCLAISNSKPLCLAISKVQILLSFMSWHE